MPLPRVVKNAENAFHGWPDQTLTIVLILAAVVIVIIALTANPLIKVAALAYIVFP